MSVIDRINSARAEYDEICQSLFETDYAPGALAQQNHYLKDLDNEIKATEHELQRLRSNLAREQKEHEKFQRSTFKRLAFKVGGKKGNFEERAAKEEREYLQAVEADFAGKRRLESLKSQHTDAFNATVSLETASKQNNDAQTALNRLFDSLFSGETPEFPEEDRSEDAAREAWIAFEENQSIAQNAEQVVQVLTYAFQLYQEAMQNILRALEASEFDMLGLGGSYADMMERSYLGKCQISASQANLAVQQARGLQPLIGDVGTVEIAQGNLMSDVIFDNIFTDYSFHKKILASRARLQTVGSKVKTELDKAHSRKARADEDLALARGVLDSSRTELMRVRQEAFGKVLEGKVQSSLPPYTETA